MNRDEKRSTKSTSICCTPLILKICIGSSVFLTLTITIAISLSAAVQIAYKYAMALSQTTTESDLDLSLRQSIEGRVKDKLFPPVLPAELNDGDQQAVAENLLALIDEHSKAKQFAYI